MILNPVGLGFLVVGLSAICRAGVIQDQDILNSLENSSKECTNCSPPEATDIDKTDNIIEEAVKDDSLDILESEEKVLQRRRRSKSSESNKSSESSKSSDSSESSESKEKREKKEKNQQDSNLQNQYRDPDSENLLKTNSVLPYISRIGRST